jgi:hypothetical protein
MTIRNVWLASAFVLLGGCGGNDQHGSSMGGSNNPPPPPVDNSIGTFVKQSFVGTSDAAEPVDINDREFTDDENETAYDDLL